MNTEKNSPYEWLEGNVIGTGSFGEVRKVRHSLDQCYYALKKVPILSNASINILEEGGIEKLLREVQLHSNINCENVVKYFTSWLEGENIKDAVGTGLEDKILEYSSEQRPVDFLYIVLELCDTDLKSWLKQFNTLEARDKETSVRNGLVQMAKGLKALHDLDIIHRDLKPSNILLKKNSEGHPFKYTWKIGDLGLSRLTNVDSDDESCIKGNLAYMAAEFMGVMSDSIIQTKAADVYSLGLICFEVLCPVVTETQRRQVNSSITLDDKPNNAINKYLKNDESNTSRFADESNIIKKMLIKWPAKRFTINQVVEHFETIENPQSKSDKLNQTKTKHTVQKQLKSGMAKNSETKSPNLYNRPIRHEIAPPVSTFAGRKAELHEIVKGFNARKNNAFLNNVVVIEGLGGIGKTNLTRKFAQLFIQQCRGDVIWITAESSGTVVASLGRLFKSKLKLKWNSETTSESLSKFYDIFREGIGFQQPPQKTEPAKDVVRLQLLLSSTLIIFDNAENWKDSSGLGLRDYLPHFQDFYTSDYKIPYFLITTRKNDFVARSCTLKLKPLRTEEAIAFVRSILECSEEAAKLLCDTLQNFPLALQQAVAYIEENAVFNYNVDQYVTDFEHKKDEAKKLLQYSFIQNSDDTYELTTFTVWKITLEKILKMNPTSIDVINILSFLPADNVECRFLRDYFNWSNKSVEISDTNNAVLLPSKYSMYAIANDQISVHRLVQKVVRLTMSDDNNNDESFLRKLMEFVRDSLLVMEADSFGEEMFGFVLQNEPCDDYFDYIFAIWSHILAKPSILKEFYAFLFLLRKKLTSPPKTDEAKMLSQTLMRIYETFFVSDPKTVTEAVQEFYKYMEKHSFFWYDEGIRIWELLDKYAKECFGVMDELSLCCTEEYLKILTDNKKYDLCLPLYEAEYEKRCQLFQKDSEQVFRILKDFARAQSQIDIEKGFQFFFKLLEQAEITFPGDKEVLNSIKKDIVWFAHYGILTIHNTKKCGSYGKIAMEICRELYENEKIAASTDEHHFHHGKELVWFLENEGDRLQEIVEVYDEIYTLYKEFGLEGFSVTEVCQKLQLARKNIVHENIRKLFQGTLPTDR